MIAAAVTNKTTTTATKKETAEKTKNNELWCIENDRGYQRFFRSNLQRRFELKTNCKLNDLIFQYDINPDPFDELSVSYFYKIHILHLSILILIGLLALSGTLASISINLLAYQKCSLYHQTCDEYIRCDPARNLICSRLSKNNNNNNTVNKCVCASENLVWDNTSCVYRKSYGETCRSTNECFHEKLGLYCNRNSTEVCNCPKPSKQYMCDCKPFQYFHAVLNKCVDKLDYGSACWLDHECKTNLGLGCENSACNCSSFHYYSGSKCIPKKQLDSDSCKSTSECDVSRGLICTNGRCKCPSLSYFNQTFGNCESIRTIDGVCMNDQNCNSTQGLKCNGTNCVCSNGFWSPIYKKCIECDEKNWTILAGACYFFSNLSTNRLDAEAECAKQGNDSRLCTISTVAELDLIQTYLIDQLKSKSEQFWLSGLSSNMGVFKWPEENLPIERSFWCPGQPSNSGGNRMTLVEACLVVKYARDSFCFDDISCHLSKRFCCEKTFH